MFVGPSGVDRVFSVGAAAQVWVITRATGGGWRSGVPGGLPTCLGCSHFQLGAVGRFRFLGRKACRAGEEL